MLSHQTSPEQVPPLSHSLLCTAAIWNPRTQPYALESKRYCLLLTATNPPPESEVGEASFSLYLS